MTASAGEGVWGRGIEHKGKRTHGHGHQCGDCWGEGAEGAQVVMREDVLKSSGGFREELTGSAPLQHSSL